MARQRDYTTEAEALFRSIAQEAGLHMIRRDDPTEVCFDLPAQPGLSVPMTFGLQNGDELNLGIGPFWSYIFPFDKVQHDFRRLAVGFIEGRCRLAELRRMGLLCKRLLEEPEGHAWRTAYTEYLLPFPILFGAKRIRYIRNEDATAARR